MVKRFKHPWSSKAVSRNVGNGKKHCRRKKRLWPNQLPGKPNLLKAVNRRHPHHKKIRVLKQMYGPVEHGDFEKPMYHIALP
jgi:hypothetical protein